GATMMLMPGLSSTNIPAQIRLFLALAVSLALAPLLLATVRRALVGTEPLGMLWLIAGELLVGALIGLLARIFFLALQALAAVVATAIGFSGIPGAPIEGYEPVPALVSLITVSAVVLMFQTDLHWEMIRGIADSYSVLPPGEMFDSRFGLVQIADQLSETFLIVLRISSPFLVYAIIVNLAVGIINKLLPQVSVYFVSLPVVLAGGLLVVYLNIEELLRLFTAEFMHWATTG
ncbi:MAG TPA: flagellar biosynthetic protein FliR, partial [Paracoccaceae bacterium]|nr:flagellar biosynthetic protein FliR [Paracoccaceae bacterium]